MNYKKRKITPRQRIKRKGFIVKGITQRHWWDRYDHDITGNSRSLMKRDTRREIEQALQ